MVTEYESNDVTHAYIFNVIIKKRDTVKIKSPFVLVTESSRIIIQFKDILILVFQLKSKENDQNIKHSILLKIVASQTVPLD